MCGRDKSWISKLTIKKKVLNFGIKPSDMLTKRFKNNHFSIKMFRKLLSLSLKQDKLAIT